MAQAALFRNRLAETKAANAEALKAQEARNAKAKEAKERELLIALIARSDSEKADLAKSPTSILRRLATKEQLEQVANELKG